MQTAKIRQFVLLAGDVIILYASLYLALWLRYLERPSMETWQNHLIPFTVIFTVWLLIFYIAHLYNLHLAVNNLAFLRLAFNSLTTAAVVALAFFYLAPGIGIAPKTNLFVYFLVFTLLFLGWRRLFNWLIKSYLPKKNIAIIGLNSEVRELIKELVGKPHLGYKIAFIVDGREEGGEVESIPLLRDVAALAQNVAKENIGALVLTADPHQSEALREALFACLPLKINYLNFPDFYETVGGKIPVGAIGQMWFLENLSEGSKAWFDRTKKIFDMILAAVILIATFPFWIIIAALVKLESRGPIFIVMPRTGRDGKVFKLIKFRSMREAGNDRSPTIADDPRVTRFGSFMRKTRLDEIPQMINILRGEMSFVGPRPERPEIAADLEKQIPFYRERTLVKPGITGSDQISGEYHSPSVPDTLKKLQYDLFYIKNRSIYLDLSIILKTVATVLSGGGM